MLFQCNLYKSSIYLQRIIDYEREVSAPAFWKKRLIYLFLLVVQLLDHHVVRLICNVLFGLAFQTNVNQMPLELWILVIHKVILQTQQGNIRFANCLTDIYAIILKYCCRAHFIIFQLDYILKLYLPPDKYIASHLHTFIFLNCMCIEEQDTLFHDDQKFSFSYDLFLNLLNFSYSLLLIFLFNRIS